MRIERTVGFLAAFLISGAVVNDALIVPYNTFVSWAKLLFLLAFMFLMLGVFKAKKLSSPDALVAIYSFLFVLFTVLISGGGVGDRFVSISTSFFIGVVFYFVITRTSVRYLDLKKAFLFWVALSVALGVLQAATGNFFFTDRVFISTVIPSLYRASGMMGDPNYFALICLLGATLSIGRSKHIYVAVHAVCLLGIILSGSRSGLLCYLLLLILKRFETFFSIKKFMVGSLFIIAFILTIYICKDYLPSSIAMIFELSSYSEEAGRNSLSDRMSAITAGYYSFIKNPLFGYGIGNLTQHPLNNHGQMSHNTIVEILAENGLTGLFLYLILNLSVLRQINKYKALKKIETRCLMLFVVVFNIMSLTIVTHYSRLFFFVLGMSMLALQSFEKERKNHEFL
ncbi:MAG: O-antigen ligase family protein [Gammaproteobacteria bacterium]|nr:MAG: O-antigen ligase family protein [Gammaproteobacteria bacterium]